ncbi:MAG: PepSY-like domain-containing protein [Bacteroidales bacterium]|nr:PepSY-like domain-containing protein [Bacteroidales bacterium]
MKNLITILFSIIAIVTFSQNTVIPSDILASFNKKYPVKDSVKTEKISNEYQITFFQKGIKSIAVYTIPGVWKETKKFISQDDVPEAISKAVEKKYKEVEFYDIYEIEGSDGLKYYELKTDTETAGYFLRLTHTGTITTTKQIHSFED